MTAVFIPWTVRLWKYYGDGAAAFTGIGLCRTSIMLKLNATRQEKATVGAVVSSD